MIRAHLVPAALAFVAGVASVSLGVAVPTLAVAGVVAFVSHPISGLVRASVVAALASGILYAHLRTDTRLPTPDAHFVHLAATVIEVRSTDFARTEAVVRLGDGAFATIAFPENAPAIGTRLLLATKRAAFDVARNPGEASLRDIEAERGITWRLVHPRIITHAPPDGGDVSLWIPRVRAWASSRLHATLGEPDATLLAGAMWGERGALPPDLRAEFQDTGTVHVLVTAGLHLGVVAGLAVALLQLLRCGRVGASLGAIAIVWAYAAFSGAHLPSLRAATMLSFVLLARASGREAVSWNALASAAIVVTLMRPASVITVSFGLSFSCVAAIFAFAGPIARACEEARVPHLASEAIGVALATQIGTWPLTAATFLVIAPYAPLANLLVVPIVGVAMMVGFLTLAASPVAFVAAMFANVETSLCDWIVAVVRFVGTLPGAHVIATPPPVWTIAVYELACVVAGIALARERIRAAIVVLVAASALCLWPPRVPTHALRITAIDVGQADAILVQTPNGHALLVDAGGRLERGAPSGGITVAEAVGERVVVPYLIRAGLHHLDAVLLSHPHGDHAGGVAPVLRTLGADIFADTAQIYAGHAYRDALDVARTRHIAIRTPRGGDIWHTDDGVTLRFYGPTLPLIRGSRSDINSNSLVFRIEFGRFRMLFTGDSGAETEARLLRAGVDLQADVLKVGHHGSAYGTTPAFLDAVSPHVAVISVGAQNLFGHPAPQTIDALDHRAIRVLRTDRDGEIQIETDGQTIHTTTFIKR